MSSSPGRIAEGGEKLENLWEDRAKRLAHEVEGFKRDEWSQLVVELDNYDLAYEIWFRAMWLVDNEEVP